MPDTHICIDSLGLGSIHGDHSPACGAAATPRKIKHGKDRYTYERVSCPECRTKMEMSNK